MSEQRIVDLESSNLYLFNLLFRHQVYLEGLKAGMTVHFRKMLNELYGEFAKFVGQSRYDTVDAFTRAELHQFIYRFRRAQVHYFNQYTQQLINLLQAFVAVDVDVTKAIYAAANSHPSAQTIKPEPAKAALTGTDQGNALLWATIAGAIVPACGLTVRIMFSNFVDTSVARVQNRINMAYANNESMKDMLIGIIGDSELNYRDGLFATFTNQNNAIIATALQHVSALTQADIAEAFYSEDQWVSIIDSKTTVICQSRNGNVYPAGEGPYPPAHWFCRSKRVPLTNGATLHDIPDTFFDWAQDQPEGFLNDALGVALATKILAGDSNVKDISVNELAIPLTLTQFGGKINLITM